MNVLLINPPCQHQFRTPDLDLLQEDGGIYPPLGLLYIAAYAEEVAECSVRVVDCLAERIDHDAFPTYLAQIAPPDVVGIQVMTFTLLDALLLANAVRRAYPQACIVFGGPHPTLYPRESVNLPDIDAVIPGEGEYVFAAVLAALKSHTPLESVPGVVTRKNQQLPVRWKHIANLDDLKMPARQLCNPEKYYSPLVKERPLTTMMSSRGCPCRCIFCDRPQMGKIFRSRSAQSVFEEMRYCTETLGIREILFYDDTFTINKQRVFDICAMIIRHRLKISWDIRARIDTMTPEMLHRLREAGCHRIHYGVESGSPRIQRRLRKPIDLKKAREIFNLSRKTGIEVLGYFMIGCPDETRSDLEKTLDLLQTLPMDYANIGIFIPYPGTEIYREALQTGVYQADYWQAFAEEPSETFVPRYWNQHFSDEELLLLLKEAHKRFYARPGYVLKRLLSLRSFAELQRKATLGVKLLYSIYTGRR